MRKIALMIALASLVSCTGLKSEFSSYDPYEKVVLNNKTETIKTNKKEKQTITKTSVEKNEKVVNKINYNEELKPVIIDSQSEYILKRLKQDYSLIESNETIKRLTKEYIEKIQKSVNKNIRVPEFLSKVNKIIKETKTKSYTLAVTRVLNNWSK